MRVPKTREVKMLVQCSKCKTKYNIPPDRVDDDSILKVRCNNCGHVFGVRRKKKAEPRQSPLPLVEAAGAEQTTPSGEEERETAAPAPEPGTEGGARADDSSPEDEKSSAPPAGVEEKEDFHLSFDDFNLDDLATVAAPAPETEAAQESPPEGNESPAPPEGPEPDLPPEPEEPTYAGLDLDLMAESAIPPREGGEKSAEPPEPEDALGGLSLDDFDLSAMSVDGPADASPAEEMPTPAKDDGEKYASMRKPEAEVPDLGELDLSDFDAMSDEPVEETRPSTREPEPEKPPLSAEDFAKGLQELDLAAFDEKEDEGLERVGSEDLVSTAPTAKVKKPAKEKKPRQPGKPLPWGLMGVVLFLATSVGYLAFNILYKPDSAFVLVNPWALKKIFARNDMQKRLEVSGAPEGGYVDRDDKKRVFVVTGRVENKTGAPVSGVRVRADLYGKSGPSVDSREAYCGNLLPRDEMLGLPLEKVLDVGERLVGEGFANVDIPPGSKVACMVVFPSPPSGVEKFSLVAVGPAAAEKKE